jgi:hypothetical protein
VYCLTLALEKQATRFIFKGMTSAWPNGKAHLIVKALLQKFRPHDAMSELEFSEAVMQMQLHPGDNPTELFSQLADIENRFGIHNYSEQQVIAAIMRLIPADYRAAVHTEMQKRSRLLTLGEMEDCVERYQRSVHPSHSAGKNKSSNNEDAEITQSAAAA